MLLGEWLILWFFKDASPAASSEVPLGPHPPNLPLLCLILGLFGCGWPCSGHSSYPSGVASGLLESISSTRAWSSLSAKVHPWRNKHVLIKTKHFETGVSCWNFLAAPKAVVIMETLTAFFFSTCVQGIYNDRLSTLSGQR